MPPLVSIVIVVYNRREPLREVLQRMTVESDYDPERIEVIVVDNASEDGSSAMVRQDFPEVRVIERDVNIGAPAWNDGFAVAAGDYVLVLDDDCYLPSDGLRRAVAAAQEHDAHLVSFSVVSTHDPDWVFSDRYPTGLLSYWGCACLLRRDALQELGGYDTDIFMWANELELTMRLLDHGYRHLYLPEVVAQHMKRPDADDAPFDLRWYRLNSRNWGYVAGKLLRPLDAAGALLALVLRSVRHALRKDRRALAGVPLTVRGFVRGLRRRRAMRNAKLSRLYRRDFHTFVNPLRLTRPIGDTARFVAARSDLYPRRATRLDFGAAQARVESVASSFSDTDSA